MRLLLCRRCCKSYTDLGLSSIKSSKYAPLKKSTTTLLETFRARCTHAMPAWSGENPTCRVSRAYHFVDNMVDAHCMRDEGGFTIYWLDVLRFIGLGLGYIQIKEYVNHVVEKAVRYPIVGMRRSMAIRLWLCTTVELTTLSRDDG